MLIRRFRFCHVPSRRNGLQGSLTLQVRQSLATTLLNPERKHGLATRDDEEALVSYLFTLPLPRCHGRSRQSPIGGEGKERAGYAFFSLEP